MSIDAKFQVSVRKLRSLFEIHLYLGHYRVWDVARYAYLPAKYKSPDEADEGVLDAAHARKLL